MAGLALESCANDVCPWTGKPVTENALMRYRGQVIGFGDPRDRDRFLAAVVALETALAPIGAPKAS